MFFFGLGFASAGSTRVTYPRFPDEAISGLPMSIGIQSGRVNRKNQANREPEPIGSQSGIRANREANRKSEPIGEPSNNLYELTRESEPIGEPIGNQSQSGSQNPD